MRQTFQKAEILKSKRLFEALISEGDTAKKFPFVLLWKEVETEQEFPLQIAFSVGKKRFPKAVDRNRIKRKLREIYRLEKADWYPKLNAKYVVLLIYVSKDDLPYQKLESKLKDVFEKFISCVSEGA